MQPLIDGKSIDQQTAEETACPECGEGMTYDARYEQGDEGDKPEYHAWAVCFNPECGHEFEF